jgi:hypothetical protein
MTVLIKMIDGEPVLSADALSLMFGVPTELILAHTAGATHVVPGRVAHASLPEEWLRAGRRRAGEARAATGSSHLVDGLEYWAAKLGAKLVFVDENGHEL